MADSFVFYKSFHEALKDLPIEQYGKLMYIINSYALDGVEPEGLEGTEKIIFTLIKPQIDANLKKRSAAAKGGRPRKTQEVPQPVTEEKSPEAETVNEETSKDNSEVKPSKSKKFEKPTVEEIKAYCEQMNYSIDADHFFNYYESKGWLIGKTPMKDWKAALRTWTKNDFTSGNSNTTKIQRDKENVSEFADYFANKTEIPAC